MKKKLLNSLIFILFIFCISVNAATINDGVGTDLEKYECTNNYQDNNYNINGSSYFSHCMRAQCNNNKYKIVYYTNSMPKCTNGNSNFYYKIYKNGCSSYENEKSCTNNTEKFCSIIMFYDCTKKGDGSNFYTTTKKTTRKITRKTTQAVQTTEPTTIVKSDTSLTSLSLSNGTIQFNKDTYDYNITVDSLVKTITVNAVPTDVNSNVIISGNENIVNGSIISVLVNGVDGTSSTYKITVNVTENEVLSSNSKLKSLIIKNYDINFDEDTFEYNVIINDKTKELDIDYEVQDQTSIVLISNNSDLKDGTIINVLVTAQDGQTTQYNINISVKKKSNILGVLFIIIILIAVLVGGYYVYKKIKTSKIGEKYEYE